MNKPIWSILILGTICMGFLWYFSFNVLNSPNLQRFLLIRNTIAEEMKIPKDAIRMAHDDRQRIKGVSFTLDDLAERDPESLEHLAGLVFTLEDEIRAEERSKNPDPYRGGMTGMRSFREVIFLGDGDLKMKLNQRSFAKRREIRESIDQDGSLRLALATLLALDADSLDLAFVEEGGALASAQLGVRLRIEDRRKDLSLPEKAGPSASIAFEQLAGKIHFYRFVQLAGGGERSYTAKASRFFSQKRRPSNVRWEKVFEAD
ncbi:MAG: hypothetical protein O6952_01575 [Planctomycetota bacterium]|nr:hypothetical protein [Planctomycetota bacterium]